MPEACCFSDGTCTDLIPTDCAAQGGTSQGLGTDCATAQCPQPPQACCFPTGGCLDLDPADCATAGGSPQGIGTDCITAICSATCTCPGDMNLDGLVDGDDIQQFVNDLLGPGACP
ncbi:MAG: hypothetical protein ACE5EQ_06765 [Phycisphaerae bacterium]